MRTIIHKKAANGFTLILSDGTEIEGFVSWESCIQAGKQFDDIQKDLEHPLPGLYEAFKHPTQDWAFMDRHGVIHATFRTKEEAQNHALKIK